MWKVTALSTHSRWIEDSWLRNVSWEELGGMSERQTEPVRVISSLFNKLEQIK